MERLRKEQRAGERSDVFGVGHVVLSTQRGEETPGGRAVVEPGFAALG
ncbi:MAG: hypothetical protein AAGE52_42075 [Myxococcota bacterium]